MDPIFIFAKLEPGEPVPCPDCLVLFEDGLYCEKHHLESEANSELPPLFGNVLRGARGIEPDETRPRDHIKKYKNINEKMHKGDTMFFVALKYKFKKGLSATSEADELICPEQNKDNTIKNLQESIRAFDIQVSTPFIWMNQQ